MSTTVETVQTAEWGKCLELRHGDYRLLVTLDCGPRIIHCSYRDGNNIFFEDPKGEITKDNGWKMIGGHRLWISPEMYPRTYDPGKEAIQWERIGTGAVIRFAERGLTDADKEIEIVFEGDRIRVDHRIRNAGAWPIEFAPWALSVLAAGGTAIVPQPNRDTGLLPNRKLILWPYTDMSDERVEWGKDRIVVRQMPDRPPFKFGLNNEHGWAAYYNNGVIFKKTYTHIMDAEYPDFGSSFELYTNGHFIEIETLGALQNVQPGEQVAHREYWQLEACPSEERFLALAEDWQ